MPPPKTQLEAGFSGDSGGDPRLALAAVYAAMFGHMGIVMPFLAPWLEQRGLGRLAIGLLLAAPPLCKMLAPFTWGAWADRSGARRGLAVAALAAAAVALAAMVYAPAGLWILALLVALYGFMRSPVLPFLEATSLEQSDRRGFDYGPIRLWGSFAFVVSSGLAGAAAAWIGLDGGLLAAAALLAVGALAAVALPRPSGPATAAHERSGPNGSVAFAGPALVRFFVVCALMQLSHGAYYTFYSIRLGELGYGEAAIGALWAFAVVCEIALLARMDRVVARVGSIAVLRWALLLAAARWLLIGSIESAGWLVLAQMLHAATYAAFHVAAVRIVHRSFGPGSRARGQALYSGMTFGLGLFAGSLIAGALAAPLGLAALFRVSAVPAVLAIIVLGRRPPNGERPRVPGTS